MQPFNRANKKTSAAEKLTAVKVQLEPRIDPSRAFGQARGGTIVRAGLVIFPESTVLRHFAL